MEDIMGKLGELLSDEESVRQLSELAQMLTSEGADGSDGGESSDGDNPAESSGNAGTPDFGALMKLTGLFGAVSQTDKNAELLMALKPHLSPERQKKVDKAIKLLKLIAVWNIAKDSGLLNDLL